jgi:alpha-N-arabinofuranosidase
MTTFLSTSDDAAGGGGMKRRALVLSAFLLASFIRPTATGVVLAQEPRHATLTIRAGEPGPVISRHIYGHFAEHLGRCIYDGLWVGPRSTVPNTRGIRNDVVQALRKIKIPNLRWPGGCFADQYHWQDGVGAAEKRPRRVNIHWGGVVEDNSFGTHEFLDFCEQIGADPYVATNVGSGSPQEMADWIEYMTFGGDSDLAKRREANGRPQPWKVPFLGIGNENWGCGGRMTPEYYSDLYRRFSVYARDWSGNRLERIAAGPGGTDLHWLDVLGERVKGGVQGISLHYYTLGNTWQDKLPATGFPAKDWYAVLRDALKIDALLTDAEKIMDKHDPVGRVGLYVDEWGTWYAAEPGTNPAFLNQQNTVRDAVVAGATFNIFHRHAKRVKMANIAQLVNVLQALILTDGDKMVLTPTYHVFDMYQVHQGATLLPVDLTTDNATLGSESLPAVSASASRDAQGVVHVSLVNLDPEAPATVEARIDGQKFTSVSGRVLTGPTMDAHNTFAAPDRVQPAAFTGASLQGPVLKVALPPRSVVVLALGP